MSPVSTSFKFQVAQLQAELSRCIEFCQDIRTNRRLEGTKNLDNLQDALEAAEISIPNSFSTFRHIAGSQMENGDDKAREEMGGHIQDIQTRIKYHLKDISLPSRQRDSKQRAGFRDLLREWDTILAGVSGSMRSLSRRIEEASMTPESRRTTDDAPTMTMRERDRMMEHLKNSWEEVIIGGSLVYVNAYDTRRMVRERPEGAWIKSVPSAPRTRTPSWTSASTRKTKVPSWERDDF